MGKFAKIRQAALDSETSILHYWGAPCARGHDGRRYVKDRSCVECRKQKVTEPSTDRSKMLNEGALKYFGKPCSRGHDGLRYASSNQCVDCARAKNAESRPPAGLTRSERFRWKREKAIERDRKRDEFVRALLTSPPKKEYVDERADLLFWVAVAV